MTSFGIEEEGGGQATERYAPLYFACPYDSRRRFKSVMALNVHIAKVHEGLPQVNARMVSIAHADAQTGGTYRWEVVLVSPPPRAKQVTSTVGLSPMS